MEQIDGPKPTPAKQQDLGKRQFRRNAVLWQATLDCGDAPLECQIYNFSAGGAKLRTSEAITRRSMVQLEGRRFGSLSARIIWQEDDWVGLSFLDAPDKVADAMKSVLPDLAA